MSKTHVLKTWPEFFEDTPTGRKPFEVRPDDRDPPYEVGDRLILEEWDPKTEKYTGRSCNTYISYVMRDERFVKAGYCIIGLTSDDRAWREAKCSGLRNKEDAK